METSKLNTLLCKKFGVQINEFNTSQLFEKYEATGFIYPAKKRLLSPYFSNIRQNWGQLLDRSNDLLWILSTPEAQENFASITFWKQSNHGLFAQHLVSTGKPTLSLKVMLAAQYATEICSEEEAINSSQNWFRPNNRYAYRIFASMFEELGDRKAFLREHQYLHLALNEIEETENGRLITEKIESINQPFIDFVRKEYGQVFVTAEELDQADIGLSRIGQKYQDHGLHRNRSVYVIKDRKSNEILGSVIANRAPLGLNFSFLENRAYYILKSDLSTKNRVAVLKDLNQVAKACYADFELQAIPIVTDQVSSELLQSQNAVFQRAYMQSIWLRSGFLQWYDHIYCFLQRLEARELAQKMFQQRLAQQQMKAAVVAA
ncbi:MAG: hypothetical protein AAF599_15080 [Bacteroidota bacterium]